MMETEHIDYSFKELNSRHNHGEELKDHVL